MNKLKKPAFLTDKDNKKLKKAVDALLSVPSPKISGHPSNKKAIASADGAWYSTVAISHQS